MQYLNCFHLFFKRSFQFPNRTSNSFRGWLINHLRFLKKYLLNYFSSKHTVYTGQFNATMFQKALTLGLFSKRDVKNWFWFSTHNVFFLLDRLSFWYTFYLCCFRPNTNTTFSSIFSSPSCGNWIVVFFYPCSFTELTNLIVLHQIQQFLLINFQNFWSTRLILQYFNCYV